MPPKGTPEQMYAARESELSHLQQVPIQVWFHDRDGIKQSRQVYAVVDGVGRPGVHSLTALREQKFPMASGDLVVPKAMVSLSLRIFLPTSVGLIVLVGVVPQRDRRYRDRSPLTQLQTGRHG